MLTKTLSFLSLILLWPLQALAQAGEVVPTIAPPSSPTVRTGATAALIGVVSMILTQLQKDAAFGAWLTRVPKPMRILFPIVLSGFGAVLAQWLTGSTWTDAMTTGGLGAAVAVFLAETHSQATGYKTGDAPPKPTPDVPPQA